MKYALLIHWKEPRTPEEAAAVGEVLEECYRHNLTLADEGVFLEGAPLALTDSAKTVRVRDGEPIVSDGPFAETKEQLGGYQVIECRDRDHAVRTAEEVLRVQRNEAGGAEMYEIGGGE